ncbi:MAG: hypothetical protein ACYDCQ_02770 [Dehalococcoidia bacterium]
MSKKQRRRSTQGQFADAAAAWEAHDAEQLDERRRSREQRRNDRRERRERRNRGAQLLATPAVVEHERDLLRAADMLSPASAASVSASTCGSCRNWMSHQDVEGRGTCDHPGSGYTYPYSDTPGCPFFDPRRPSSSLLNLKAHAALPTVGRRSI